MPCGTSSGTGPSVRHHRRPTHWYNGLIYQSDIARGAASWRFNGGESFKAEKLDRLNPQTQTYTTD